MVCGMRKSDVIKHYGTLTAVAAALDISLAAVSQWKRIVPEGSAYKIESLTAGKLKVDPRLYPSHKRKPATLAAETVAG